MGWVIDYADVVFRKSSSPKIQTSNASWNLLLTLQKILQNLGLCPSLSRYVLKNGAVFMQVILQASEHAVMHRK